MHRVIGKILERKASRTIEKQPERHGATAGSILFAMIWVGTTMRASNGMEKAGFNPAGCYSLSSLKLPQLPYVSGK